MTDVQALAETVRAGMDYGGDYMPNSSVKADALAALDELVALLNKQEEARVEGREGMVTVYDHEGVYLGCMGIETWRAALSSPPVASGTEGEDG